MEILTLNEVAALLRVGRTTAYALAQQGEIPSFKVGGQWRFRRSEIEEWMRLQRTPAARILLVEDDPDDAELMKRCLADNGISNPVATVTDGQAALDQLLGPGPLPSVVLLDLKLPKVSGLEVLEQLRRNKRCESVPVVVLTSSRSDEDRVRSLELGAVAFMSKPPAIEELTGVLRGLGLVLVLAGA